MKEIFTGEDKKKYIILPLTEYFALYIITCLISGVLGYLIGNMFYW